MIINIRGTSGSGKSTLMRKIMALYDTAAPFYKEGRRQPLGYTLWRNAAPRAAVIGHYETACGGCDTISEIDEIYRLVRRAASEGLDVVYEGLLISAEVNRVVELSRDHDVIVIALDTPLATCLDSINKRRRAKNPDAPSVNPKNTASKHKGVQSSIVRLLNESVEVHEVNRDDALDIARRALRV